MDHERFSSTTKRLRAQFLSGYIIILEIKRVMAKTAMQLSDKDLPHLLSVLISSSSSILSTKDFAYFPHDQIQQVLAGNNFARSEFAVLRR